MPHSLVLKCPTWDHVEAFYARKVKEGGGLSARVPFQPEPGEIITLALELPDQLVIALDAEVEEATPTPDGKKSSVRLRMVGLTSSVRRRLESLVDEARRERAEASAVRRGPSSSASARVPPIPAARRRADTGLPPPLPTDAPMDELVEPLLMPTADDVPSDLRPLFEELDQELHRMREAAAHEVLGVKWGAEVDDIRRAYFALSKRLHPDVLARHRSPALHLIASEVFIHVNRAYDRMRDDAVASGVAI
ncbi:MAG TPA: DnaJ domain-containing protein, partial [Kofleriaceae bacterium]|nr:DnaJ domain-containing protein [Kofleriaceae bacterium]